MSSNVVEVGEMIQAGEVGEVGEVGETKDKQIQQIIAKYGLKCELCFLDEEDHQQIEQQQKKRGYLEVRLIPAKVISITPPKKSYIVSCDYHFSKIEQIVVDKLYKHIEYSVNQLDIKKTKLIRISAINFLEAIQKIQNNYCCRVLKCRYSNIEKQIQRLNYDNFTEIVKDACEQKKKNLQLTKTKFEFYVKNQQKMILRQQFLIYHFYKRLEAKKSQINKNFILEQSYVDTLSQSMSMPITSQLIKESYI
ncbi:unnamed protein product [Paramecium sonneborni]|uniref:Uncharacterized protein n=1 Tax=Paramecium sonneborni TaxID=65129 RepID=A0A8S1MXH7_9CILI|nr:unnamed protein product [Paramecium sonneborni]